MPSYLFNCVSNPFNFSHQSSTKLLALIKWVWYLIEWGTLRLRLRVAQSERTCKFWNWFCFCTCQFHWTWMIWSQHAWGFVVVSLLSLLHKPSKSHRSFHTWALAPVVVGTTVIPAVMKWIQLITISASYHKLCATLQQIRVFIE